ncbi:hypothetical protein EAF04_003013 [Stromatinia cepivora]|nr:hypothetical protein EAF04_003013 [Stromatinia cepivora]
MFFLRQEGGGGGVAGGRNQIEDREDVGGRNDEGEDPGHEGQGDEDDTTDEEDQFPLVGIPRDVLHNLNMTQQELEDEELEPDEHDRKGIIKVSQRLTKDGGMLLAQSSEKPSNYYALLDRLNADRNSPPPTEEVYNSYISAVRNKDQDVFIERDFLFKEPRQPEPALPDCGVITRQEFTILGDHDGLKDLVGPQPDYIEGFHNRRDILKALYDDVDGAAEMLENESSRSLVLPSLAGHWTRPGVPIEMAMIQLRYIGAAMVTEKRRALKRIRNFMGMKITTKEQHRGVITFKMQESTLTFYTHFRRTGKSKKYSFNMIPEYHMYELHSVVLNRSLGAFQQGWKLIRNAQELGLFHSNLLIRALSIVLPHEIQVVALRARNRAAEARLAALRALNAWRIETRRVMERRALNSWRIDTRSIMERGALNAWRTVMRRVMERRALNAWRTETRRVMERRTLNAWRTETRRVMERRAQDMPAEERTARRRWLQNRFR